MTTMITEVYDAFRTAGTPETEARKAAEALSASTDRFTGIETRMEQRFTGIEVRMERMEGRITLLALSSVGIHDGADPLLRRNRIHDGKSAGVLVYEGGLGTIEDNDIFGNALSGVEIKEQGNPTVRKMTNEA